MRLSNVIPLKSDLTPPLGDRQDDQLMILACAGHKQAFGILVERYASKVINFCAKFAYSISRGEEIAQDTWLQVWSYRNRYRPEGKFSVFLFTIARNRCRNHARNRGRKSRWMSDNLDGTVEQCSTDASQLDLLIEREKSKYVLGALSELPEKFRETLTLRFDQGLEYQDIALIVGRSESTVRSRVFHGLKKLRLRMEKGNHDR